MVRVRGAGGGGWVLRGGSRGVDFVEGRNG